MYPCLGCCVEVSNGLNVQLLWRATYPTLPYRPVTLPMWLAVVVGYATNVIDTLTFHQVQCLEESLMRWSGKAAPLCRVNHPGCFVCSWGGKHSSFHRQLCLRCFVINYTARMLQEKRSDFDLWWSWTTFWRTWLRARNRHSKPCWNVPRARRNSNLFETVLIFYNTSMVICFGHTSSSTLETMRLSLCHTGTGTSKAAASFPWYAPLPTKFAADEHRALATEGRFLQVACISRSTPDKQHRHSWT
jgi:hypothetical protein